MNRRKKIKSILTKKAKQANLKANPKSKPKYISKAERAKLETETNQVESDACQPTHIEDNTIQS
ncbi:DUF2986 domain-containing protein [Marinomonas sp. TW1]|uniref:DUF2986 domain-containing protein n=1 Tax=Marinomonas sp. TW1 TaxID=1561203 RepID=UPI0007AF37AA|nr:DUF2986 domain-containing protein [Marinomonas sp. TW1]KZN15433.1 hypothetical protein OA79_01340 [Marinomonas sp. TW1]